MVKQHKANEEVIVGNYLVELLGKNEKVVAKGEVSAIQKFLPEQKFIFTGDLVLIDNNHIGLKILSGNEVIDKCKFIESGNIAPIIVIDSNFSDSLSVSFILSNPPVTFGSGEALHTLAFNLVNFNEDVLKSEITFGDWFLMIEKIASKNEYDELKRFGGYLITHLGFLQKKDGADFTADEPKSVLNFLYLLLSFCKGVPTPTFLTQGLNSTGDVVWYEIGGKRIASWKKCNNWFTDAGIDLNAFTSGFHDLFNSKNFKNHIAEIINWYNTVYITSDNYSSVIICHTALELISWTYLTKELNVLTADGYEKLSSGDRLSLTLTYKGIPINTPPKLKKLDALGKANNLSGPLLYSTVRNKIVHPPSKRRNDFIGGKVVFETRLLGAWYLELFILALSNYNGHYSNITDYSGYRGATEFVPWANSRK
jgi:hypothetical protein